MGWFCLSVYELNLRSRFYVNFILDCFCTKLEAFFSNDDILMGCLKTTLNQSVVAGLECSNNQVKLQI